MHEMIVILDFGGQYNQLIARRVRECNVYCEVKSYKTPLEEIKAMNPKGIIFTGGPNSVYLEDSPSIGKEIFELGVPVLGICYGCQLMSHVLGGKVESATTSEYGKTETFFNTDSLLFKGLKEESITWMSHTDLITGMPEGFTSIAHTSECPVAAMENKDAKLYGMQYHLEDYETAFRAHAAAGRDVLCLVFTGKMSGCVGSARNARELVLEDYPDARIEVMDSAAATVTEAVMVENAVAMRDAGCSLDETVTWLEAEKITNQIFFTVGNLDYLIKGGRIGKVTGRAANMLGIKPMILFKDGEIFSGGVARGRQKSFEKALEQLMNYLAAHGGTPDDYRITVGYGYDADEGKRLWMQTRAALRAKYPGAQCEVGLLQIGCTIAVHTGPYALGMGVMRRWKKQG